MFAIENDVPMPEKPTKLIPIDKRLGGKYGFGRLEVSQSIFIKGERIDGRAYAAAMRFARRNSRRFKCIEMDDGLRIWRTE